MGEALSDGWHACTGGYTYPLLLIRLMNNESRVPEIADCGSLGIKRLPGNGKLVMAIAVDVPQIKDVINTVTVLAF